MRAGYSPRFLYSSHGVGLETDLLVYILISAQFIKSLWVLIYKYLGIQLFNHRGGKEKFWKFFKKCFLAVQQWRWKVNSSSRHGFWAQWGSAGSRFLCATDVFSPGEGVLLHPGRHQVLEPILRGGFKKLNKLKALKTSSEYNHLQLSMEKYVLSGNLMAKVILHSWGVKCAVLRDLLCFAEERRVASGGKGVSKFR